MQGFAAADLDAALQAASGASAPNVVAGAASCFGVLRRTPFRDGETMSVIGEEITVTIRDGAIPTPNNDTSVTVNGDDFLVRDPGYRDGDGLRRLTVVEAD